MWTLNTSQIQNFIEKKTFTWSFFPVYSDESNLRGCKSLKNVQGFFINVNLVVSTDVSKSNNFSIIRLPDLSLDQVMKKQVVNHWKMNITFHVWFNWEFGILCIERTIIDSFQRLLIFKYSIFPHPFSIKS